MATTVQLKGGNFSDAQGNPLFDGYLIFELNQDAIVNGTVRICSGIKIKFPLDNTGNLILFPVPIIWPNDIMTPNTTYYTVSGYTAEGTLAWGPNTQSVPHTPNPFDLGAWVPNTFN